MIDLDAIAARANAATPGPWTYHDGCGYVEVPPCGAIEFKPGWERSVHFLARVHNNHVEGEDGLGFDGAFIAHARTDVPALIARVRELEAECAKLKEAFERIRSTNTDLMMQLFEAQEATRAVNISPVLHENAQLRSKVLGLSAEVERLTNELQRERIGIRPVDEVRSDAFRRGAEAMRDECIGAACEFFMGTTGFCNGDEDELEAVLEALPIPEEP